MTKFLKNSVHFRTKIEQFQRILFDSSLRLKYLLSCNFCSNLCVTFLVTLPTSTSYIVTSYSFLLLKRGIVKGGICVAG